MARFPLSPFFPLFNPLFQRELLVRDTLQESPLDLSLTPPKKSTKNEEFQKGAISQSTNGLATRNRSKNQVPLEVKVIEDLPSNFFPVRSRGRQSANLNPSRNMLPCEVCGKAFDRPSLLRRHMRTHTGEKPHVCDVCGKGFSTSSSLNTHRRIHSGEKPHECPMCGKRFTASSNLYYHRMTHTKDKPHKCSLCGKSFPTPGDLKAHAYIHNGRWPFKCSICNRGFSKQTNLKNHLFLHTGDKPHVCNVCDKRFALACNLRAHLKTHQGAGASSESNPMTSNLTNTTTTSSTTAMMNEENSNNCNSPPSSKRACSPSSSSSSSRSSTASGLSSGLTTSIGQMQASLSPVPNIIPMVKSRSTRSVISNDGHENKNLEQFLHLMTASLLAMKTQQQQQL